MSIQVFLLQSSIQPSSVEEYLDYKEALELKKTEGKKIVDEETGEIVKEKVRRYVFVTTSDTFTKAMQYAGITYEGEINLEGIEFCKVESQKKCLCGNLHIPKLDHLDEEEYRMYFFLNKKNIVILDDDGFANKIIRQIMFSRVKPGQSRERFLYNFCAQFMSEDLENLGRYEKIIMKMEDEISNGDLDDVTSDIARLRKELLILREYYDELKDFGKALEENENNFFSGKNLSYFGIISDRADRLMGRTMYLLDYCGQVRETYQGKVAEQQNSNMEFLTIISTIFFPLTLITGWYGMNFQNMPELARGYPFVIGLSLLVVAIIIIVFKKRKIF